MYREVFSLNKKNDLSIFQELMAYGFSNFVSSIFNGFVSAASLSRTVVQEQTGGMTQV